MNGGVDLNRPKSTESALLGSAVAEGIHTGFEHGRTSETDLALTSPLVALYSGKEVLATFYVLGTSFNSWHISLDYTEASL